MIVIPLDVQAELAEYGFQITDLAGVRVTMNDVRRAGFCAPGLKDWLVTNGFTLRDLVNTGLSAAQVAATGNAYGVRGVVTALERERDSGST